MNIEINKERVETVRFASLEYGCLFRNPSDKSTHIQMTSGDGYGISLLDGSVDDGYAPDDYVVDVTNDYKLVNA